MSQPPVIVGLGETLWDCFSDRRCLGGAPLNFACSAAELAQADTDVLLASSVGKDDLGSEAIVATRQHRVNTSAIQRSDRPTGRVLVELNDAGVPSYQFEEDAAWDRFRWNEKLLCLAKVSSAVCFGSLGQRSAKSRQTIQRFVASTSGNTLRVFDINLRPPFVNEAVIDESLRLANVLKLNEASLLISIRFVSLQDFLTVYALHFVNS